MRRSLPILPHSSKTSCAGSSVLSLPPILLPPLAASIQKGRFQGSTLLQGFRNIFAKISAIQAASSNILRVVSLFCIFISPSQLKSQRFLNLRDLFPTLLVGTLRVGIIPNLSHLTNTVQPHAQRAHHSRSSPQGCYASVSASSS